MRNEKKSCKVVEEVATKLKSCMKNWTQNLRVEWEIKKKCKVAEEFTTNLQSCMKNGDKSSKLNEKLRKDAKLQKNSLQSCNVAWEMKIKPRT